jgi:hypothetical protein
MATIGNRASTWTNSDGLVIGFGTNKPAYTSGVTKNGGITGSLKQASTVFDWTNLNAAHGINSAVPAGAKIMDVRMEVIVGFTSTGTNTITVGDGSDADGFITVSAATSATMASAGAVILADGVYAFGATDTGAAELHTYAAADTIDVASAQTDWTAGKAVLVVSYI